MNIYKAMKSAAVGAFLFSVMSAQAATGTGDIGSAGGESGFFERACIAVGVCDTREEKAAKLAELLKSCKQMALSDNVCLKLSESHPTSLSRVTTVIETLKSNLVQFNNDKTSAGKLLFSTGLKPMSQMDASDSYWARGQAVESQMVPVVHYLASSGASGSNFCEQVVGLKVNCVTSAQQAPPMTSIVYYNQQTTDAINALLQEKKFWNRILNIVLQGNRIRSFVVEMKTAEGENSYPEFNIRVSFADKYDTSTQLVFPLIVDIYEFGPTSHGLAYQVKLNP